MLKGICPECGKVFFGWALQNPEHQHCELCGALLVIFDEKVEKTEEGRRNRDFHLERARQINRELRARHSGGII